MPVGKNLWDLAVEESAVRNTEAQIGGNVTVLIVGAKNSGKTSITNRFLDKHDLPKPTVALEYTYGRLAKGHKMAKDVGHIWELGGGVWLSKLMEIPINVDTIHHTSLLVVVDLSNPSEIWLTLESLLKTAKSHIQTIVDELKMSDPRIVEKLKQRAWKRVGEDHHDKDLIDPFFIPLAIIGGKYDIFKDFDPEKRKVICKTLRFIAHHYGATLQFFSIHDKQLLIKSKALLNHYLFGTQSSKTVQTETTKPLLIPVGHDTFQHIDPPPISEEDIGRLQMRIPMELWKHAFISHFPQEKSTNPATATDHAKDPQFKEPVIDSLKVQKDQELERYRQQAEKAAKQNYGINYDT